MRGPTPRGAIQPVFVRHSPLRKRMVGAVILAALLAVACQDRTKKDTSDEAPALREIPVSVVPVARHDLRETIVSTSAVDSRHSVDVLAEIPGTVVHVDVEQGDIVGKNQRLARIQREELNLGLESASAAVQRLEREVERLEPLHDKGIIPRRQYDEARYRLEEARAERRRASTAIGDTRVKSPIEGVIALRHVDPGQQVVTGAPLFRVVEPGDLVVHVDLPERVLGDIFEGQEAFVRSDALEDAEFPARVDRISPVVDPRTGTVRVTLDIEDVAPGDAPTRSGSQPTAERRRLRPGMFVKTFIVTARREGVLAIPRRAVESDDQGSRVFVDAGGTARRKSVKIGIAEGALVEILSGLEEGEEVVVIGQDGLKDGTAIASERRDATEMADDGS